MAEPPDPVFVFRGDMANVLCILPVFSQGSELLLVGTTEGFVHVWDLKTKREKKKINVGKGPCSSILETPEGYATLEKGDAVHLWSQNWDLLQTLPVDFCGFCNLEYDGQLLVPDNDGVIRTVNWIEEVPSKILYKPEKKYGEVMCMKHVKSSSVIIACYEKGLVSVWDSSGRIVCEVEIEDTPMCMDFCEGTSQVLVGTSGHFLSLFTLDNKLLKFVRRAEITNSGISGVSIRPDGKLCAASCWDQKVRYFSTKTLKLLAVLDHKGSLNCLRFSPYGWNSASTGLAFVGSNDGRVTIWNLFQNK